MLNTTYDISANVSKFEWYLIQEMRKLQEHGYGELNMTFVDSKCVNFKPALTEAPSTLIQLQT